MEHTYLLKVSKVRRGGGGVAVSHNQCPYLLEYSIGWPKALQLQYDIHGMGTRLYSGIDTVHHNILHSSIHARQLDCGMALLEGQSMLYIAENTGLTDKTVTTTTTAA